MFAFTSWHVDSSVINGGSWQQSVTNGVQIATDQCFEHNYFFMNNIMQNCYHNVVPLLGQLKHIGFMRCPLLVLWHHLPILIFLCLHMGCALVVEVKWFAVTFGCLICMGCNILCIHVVWLLLKVLSCVH